MHWHYLSGLIQSGEFGPWNDGKVAGDMFRASVSSGLKFPGSEICSVCREYWLPLLPLCHYVLSMLSCSLLPTSWVSHVLLTLR